MIQSICIVRLSALGDVLMLVPLVRTLQAALPKATITWIISKPAYNLVAHMENVEFIVLEKPQGMLDYWQFFKRMKARRFDVLLAAQASFRANLLYPLIKATRKIGYDKLRAKDGHAFFIHESITPGKDHTLECFLKFADVLGIKDKQIRWDLPIEEKDKLVARQLLPKQRPILVVNPAASKPERSWPVERYITVIREAQKLWNVQVVLTGGPGDFDKMLGETIEAAVPVTNLIGKTKPEQLLALIQEADAVLCPDTGPSHMAAAVSTPVIALHAVTSAEVSGPYIFRHLAVDYYPEAVKTVLKTTWENNIWGRHAHGEETMLLVPVSDVLEKLGTLFDAV